jgi:hypothetical protein
MVSPLYIHIVCFPKWFFKNLNHVKTNELHNVLHIMVKHNPKKREKKLFIFYLYYGKLDYIYMKKTKIMS